MREILYVILCIYALPNAVIAVILLDWSGVDLTPKSTPYAKKLVELQDSNAAPNQIYTINSKSWQRVGVWVRGNSIKLTR